MHGRNLVGDTGDIICDVPPTFSLQVLYLEKFQKQKWRLPRFVWSTYHVDATHSQVDVETEFGVVLLDSVSLSIIASIKWHLACIKFLETAKDGLLLLSDILLCIVYC